MHLQKKKALPGHYACKKSSPTSKAKELSFLHARREASQKWLTLLSEAILCSQLEMQRPLEIRRFASPCKHCIHIASVLLRCEFVMPVEVSLKLRCGSALEHDLPLLCHLLALEADVVMPTIAAGFGRDFL
jgi:hypothetical protein